MAEKGPESFAWPSALLHGQQLHSRSRIHPLANDELRDHQPSADAPAAVFGPFF